MAREVEVAFPSVEFPVAVRFVAKKFPAVNAVEDAYGNCDDCAVELEKKTPCVQMLDVVAAEVVPNVLAKVNGAEPTAVCAAQPNWPLVQVRKLPAWQVASCAP
jgi:hypothetical protein